MDPAFDLLSESARGALVRARRKAVSYAVRTYACPGPTVRLLVVLGEAHLKLGAASRIGKEAVAQFSLRGVETVPVDRVLAGRALWAVIHLPRLALRALSFGLVKGSTIVDAKRQPTGRTVELERSARIPIALHIASLYLSVFFAAFWLQFVLLLFGLSSALLTAVVFAFELHLVALVPALVLRRRSWSWVLYPAVAILTVRDAIMAKGTVQMLADNPDEATALVIMGRAHLPGYERELVETHGFRRIPF